MIKFWLLFEVPFILFSERKTCFKKEDLFQKHTLEVLHKKVILKISQKLQKNTWDGVSF